MFKYPFLSLSWVTILSKNYFEHFKISENYCTNNKTIIDAEHNACILHNTFWSWSDPKNKMLLILELVLVEAVYNGPFLRSLDVEMAIPCGETICDSEESVFGSSNTGFELEDFLKFKGSRVA